MEFHHAKNVDGSWEQALDDVMAEMWEMGSDENSRPLAESYDAGDWDQLTWDAVENFENNLYPLAFDLRTLITSKQRDYGHGNINKFGVQGIEVRLWDKIARRDHLIASGVTPYNESVLDTDADIVGYLALRNMVLQGTFTRPLAEQMHNHDHEPVESIEPEFAFKPLDQDQLDAVTEYVYAVPYKFDLSGPAVEGVDLAMFLPHKLVKCVPND
jgi:hypothetical protein